jgi:hypothetical protein
MFRMAVVAMTTFGVAGLFSTPSNAAWYLALGDYQYASGEAFGPDAEGVTIRFENDTSYDGPGSAVKVTIKNDTTDAPIADVHLQRVVFNIKDFVGLAGNSMWGTSPGFTPLFSVAHLTGFAAQSIEVARNNKHIEVNPEKYFDIALNYSPGFSGGFNSGMTSVYRIASNVAGFDENAFRSVNIGAVPNLFAAVKYGYATGSGKSGALEIIDIPDGEIVEAVPLPGSLIGLVLAGLSLVVFRGSMGLVA